MGVSTDAILFWGINLDEGEGYNFNDGGWTWFWEISSKDKETKIVVDTHCSMNYPLYFIAVQHSVVIASRGFSVEIDDLSVGEDWHEKFKEFCEDMNIEYKEPKWYLVSYWG